MTILGARVVVMHRCSKNVSAVVCVVSMQLWATKQQDRCIYMGRRVKIVAIIGDTCRVQGHDVPCSWTSSRMATGKMEKLGFQGKHLICTYVVIFLWNQTKLSNLRSYYSCFNIQIWNHCFLPCYSLHDIGYYGYTIKQLRN